MVAGVEISSDGGVTWHLATGTTSWSYTYVQHGAGTQSVRIRAVDDSANYAATPTTVSYTVTGPFSVFGAEVPAKCPGLGLELPVGRRFHQRRAFHKSAANTGLTPDRSGTRPACVWLP